MEARIDNVYTTPIYVAQITEQEGLSVIQEEAKRAIEASEFSSREEWGPTHYLSSTTFINDVIKEQNMRIFSAVLNSHLSNYMDIVGFSMRPYMVTSWFSLFQEHQYGQLHNHGNADVSGCYYVETSGDDGELFFEDPRPSNETSYVFSGRYMSGRRAYRPRVGQMLMFPGYLPHGIKTNTTTVDRVSLSFNIKFIDPRCELKSKNG
jgi:uncharacterized protein (TIGR02466 family)